MQSYRKMSALLLRKFHNSLLIIQLPFSAGTVAIFISNSMKIFFIKMSFESKNKLILDVLP